MADDPDVFEIRFSKVLRNQTLKVSVKILKFLKEEDGAEKSTPGFSEIRHHRLAAGFQHSVDLLDCPFFDKIREMMKNQGTKNKVNRLVGQGKRFGEGLFQIHIGFSS